MAVSPSRNAGAVASGTTGGDEFRSGSLTLPDLNPRIGDGKSVDLKVRVVRILGRRTPAGHQRAVVIGAWRGRAVRCVVFPTVWARLDEQPTAGDGAVVRGILRFREEQPVLQVLDLTRLRLSI